jgi:hypothetical protein
MFNLTRISGTVLCAGLMALLAPASKANVIVSNIPEYNGPADFDFNAGDYPLGSVTIGNFLFSIPANQLVTGATISGTFGNNDVSSNTALSDYFVNHGGIEVASCDDPTADCFSGQTGVPTPWSYTFTANDLKNLSAAFSSGSLDFSAVQNFAISVQTGVTTLTIDTAASTAPEPSTFFVIGGGLAGLACLRRRRGKV